MAAERSPTTDVRTRTRIRAVDSTARDPEALTERASLAIPEAYGLVRDRVRWGPVWAGLLAAMTTLLILSLLGLAIGLTTINAGTAARTDNLPAGTESIAAIWGIIAGILAFLVGGYVAGRTAAVFDRRWGGLNGALVFMLALPLTLWLASQGLGALLGNLGTFASALNIDPSAVRAAANQVVTTSPNVQPIDVARAAEQARNSAWWTLLGLLLGLGASAVGGMMATRRRLDVAVTPGAAPDEAVQVAAH